MGHVWGGGGRSDAYRVLIEIREEKRHLGRP